MDLNRDLPPLPAATDLQAVQVCDKSDQHSFESKSELGFGFLQPLYYDPVRDSLRFGSVHYHPDGMRYYPEVLQHSPRTSSMAAPGAPSDTSYGTINPHHKAMECSKRSTAAHIFEQDVSGPGLTPDSGHISDASSGIMGNFIPVKTVALHSVTAARAIHALRIE
jgi:hypothetical protein